MTSSTTPPIAISRMPLTPDQSRQPRLLSLDFMRGLIMVLLALDATGLYEHLTQDSENSFFHPLMIQFSHHPWHGLRVWDLVQPCFMFMAGAAMAFSLHRQRQQGMSWSDSFRKALKRSGWLFFWGVLDYAVRPGGLSFELWDVLTQLSFTSLLAFLIFRWSVPAQIAVCAGLLLLTEILYRFTHVPGFDQPFTDQRNFGNYVDLLLMHQVNDGGWVAINCIPTAVHTIGGALAGKLLLGDKAQKPGIAPPDTGISKVKTLILWGVITLVLGYVIDAVGVTPIIKRIATSSFVLVSLGWALLVLALCYWWIDIRDHRKYLQFFLVIGMNSIFIYLFFEIVGDHWFNKYVAAVTDGLMKFTHIPLTIQAIVTSISIFMLEWGLCYFLYRKKIFFRV